VRRTAFLPMPIQSPRVPIWVAATFGRKRPLRRAARYDGVVPMPSDINERLTPDNLREIIEYVREHRVVATPFDVVQSGVTRDSSDKGIVAPFVEAGATWWFESPPPWIFTLEQVRDRIHKGPPRL
jgi:hypothetical protein